MKKFYTSEELEKFCRYHIEKTLGYMNYIRVTDLYKILRDICLSTRHNNRDTQGLILMKEDLELIITTNTSYSEMG